MCLQRFIESFEANVTFKDEEGNIIRTKSNLSSVTKLGFCYKVPGTSFSEIEHELQTFQSGENITLTLQTLFSELSFI